MSTITRSFRRSLLRAAVLLFAVVAMVVPAQANATPDAEPPPSGAGDQSAAQPLDPVEEAEAALEEPVAPGEVSTFDVQTRTTWGVSVKVNLPSGTDPRWLANAYASLDVVEDGGGQHIYSSKKIDPSTGEVTFANVYPGRYRVIVEFRKDVKLDGTPKQFLATMLYAPGVEREEQAHIFTVPLSTLPGYHLTGVTVNVPKYFIETYRTYPNGVLSMDRTVRWFQATGDPTQPGVDWAFIDNGGNARSGWRTVDGYWHWTENSAILARGWRYISGKWYFFSVVTSRMETGWLLDWGAWYYLRADGSMATGWVKDGGSWYYLHPSSGAMATGWVKDGSSWYYLNPSSGAMTTGWAWINGSWYYFRSSGAMATGWVQIGGVWYFFNASGAWVQ